MGSESGLENRDHRWFKTKVKGGEDTLRYLTRAASEESAFIVSAAATTLRLIQIGQNINGRIKSSFRKLCEDAVDLTCLVYDTYLLFKGSHREWPGHGLTDAVLNCLDTLKAIQDFAEVLTSQSRLARAMGSLGGGGDIKILGGHLAKATSRFKFSVKLQAHDELSSLKNLLEGYQKTNAGDTEDNDPFPAAPSDAQEQSSRDAVADMLAAIEQRCAEELAAEQEARRKELEVMNAKLEQMILMLKNAPPPSQSPAARDDDSSDDNVEILNMTLHHATGKRAMESKRKDYGAILDSCLRGSNLNGPGYSGAPCLSPHRGPTRTTNKNSGNVRSTIVYGSRNDNSTVTRIHKGPPGNRNFPIWPHAPPVTLSNQTAGAPFLPPRQ